MSNCTSASVPRVGSVIIVDGMKMLRKAPDLFCPPADAPEPLVLLHYVSPTQIHRYCADFENFELCEGGLKTSPRVSRYTIEYDPSKSYYPAERIRHENHFNEEKTLLEWAGLSPQSAA